MVAGRTIGFGILKATNAVNFAYKKSIGQVYGFYKTKEGIDFISYSKAWDTNKLKELHAELLKNRHGNEINALTSVIVNPKEPKEVAGEYDSYNKTITLYYGNKIKTAVEYKETLTHEYGHHVQAILFSGLENGKDSEWLKLRGLKKYYKVSGKEDMEKHQDYLCEIFAEDYKMLYGAINPLTSGDLSDEDNAFKHENQSIPDIMNLPEEQKYLEKVTGWKIDRSRFVKKENPLEILHTQKGKVLIIKSDGFQQNSTEYFEKIEYYKKVNKTTYKATPYRTSYSALETKNNGNQYQTINLTEVLKEEKSVNKKFDFDGVMRITITSVNKKSGRAVESEPFFVTFTTNGNFELAE